MIKQPKSDKIWFLQMLRGIAALIVVYAHMWELFWRDNVTATTISYSSPIEGAPFLPHLKLTTWLYDYHINFGAIGVALFFLVSGFVIPISLEKMGSAKFLFRRIFRLYPVYIVGLFITFLTLAVSARMNDIPFNFTIIDYLKNATLFRDWFWVLSIDNVNWTLENEVKFYILCAFLYWISGLRSIKSISITTGSLFIFTYIATNVMPLFLNNSMYGIYRFSYILSNATVFLTYMFIGTCFFNLFKGYWSKKEFSSMIVCLYALFILNSHYVFPTGSKEYLVNYTLILIIFSVVYYLRERIKYSSILNFFADISYPMYIIHGVVGYALLSFLYKYQPYPYLVLLEVFLIVIGLSYLLHRLIELPFNEIGHKLSSGTKRIKNPAVEEKQVTI